MSNFIWNSRRLFRVLIESQSIFRLHRSSKKDIHLKEKNISSKLLDLSLGGCGLESPYFVPVGVKINIFLDRNLLNTGQAMPKKKLFTKIVGVVRTCRQLSSRKYRLGIQFEKLSSEDTKLMSEFLDNQERRGEKRIIFPSK